jgi:hypothetical protein
MKKKTEVKNLDPFKGMFSNKFPANKLREFRSFFNRSNSVEFVLMYFYSVYLSTSNMHLYLLNLHI